MSRGKPDPQNGMTNDSLAIITSLLYPLGRDIGSSRWTCSGDLCISKPRFVGSC